MLDTMPRESQGLSSTSSNSSVLASMKQPTMLLFILMTLPVQSMETRLGRLLMIWVYYLGVAESKKKALSPSTKRLFLGVEFDTIKMCMLVKTRGSR